NSYAVVRAGGGRAPDARDAPNPFSLFHVTPTKARTGHVGGRTTACTLDACHGRPAGVNGTCHDDDGHGSRAYRPSSAPGNKRCVVCPIRRGRGGLSAVECVATRCWQLN